jgi:hypothetical protein
MKTLALCAMAAMAATFNLPASAASAAKCTAQYTDGNWPYYATLKYQPENTTFKFVCPGLPAKTIPELYKAGWKLVGLPWLESNFGGGNKWAIWIQTP